MAEPQKITPELESHARDNEDDALLDVVVELVPGPAQQGSMDEMKAAFRQAADPVTQAIAGLGGEVQDEAWINSTLKARVPAKGLGDLSDVQEVAALDVGHPLERD